MESSVKVAAGALEILAPAAIASMETPAFLTSPTFDALGGVWVMIGWAGFAFFYFNKNPPLKRRLLPWYVALMAAYPIAFPLSIGEDVPIYGVVIFAVIVGAIAVVNYLRVRFCDACGRTVLGKALNRPETCSYCRTPLRRSPNNALEQTREG